MDTGVVTPPASWSGTIISPGTGQRVFACRATVNPVMETGILTPTWSGVYTLGSEGLDGDDGEDGSVWSIGLGFPDHPEDRRRSSIQRQRGRGPDLAGA